MRVFSFPLFAATAAIAHSAAASSTDALPDLGAHRWKQRILIINTPAADSPAYQTQAATLLPVWSGLLDRDLHILTLDSSPAFRVRLVGKDGGVKLDQPTPVSAADLFALIDAMPMRRDEARRSTPSHQP